ncbi:MAG: hypothetical protein LQ338_004782 [Usnochroma carphineum]|nr:MAG: hypothetical protein LQ338_004782 [Usnochroma carphineum]
MATANGHSGPLYFQKIADELHSRAQNANASTNLTLAVLTIVLTYQVFYWLDYPVLPMSELLWNSAVHATPSRIISALESALLPTTTDEARNGAERSKSISHAQKSETMRRMLGLDGTGMLSKFQRAKSLPVVSTLLQARSKDSPPGLGNWDNSCYQNSVIQGLASLPSFSAFLHQPDSGHPSRSTRAALKDVIGKLKDEANMGTTCWTPPQLKSMSSWQQQDAQEYFSKLVDEVEKEAAQDRRRGAAHPGLAAVRDLSPDLALPVPPKLGKADDEQPSSPKTVPSLSQLPDELQSIVARNPFEGLLAQRVGCLRCGFVEGLSIIPFYCLTLPLGKQWLYDIRSCLDEYTALEPINGVDCAKCTLLQSKIQLEKLQNQFSEEPARELQASAPLVSEALKASVEERLQAVNEALDNKDFSDNTILKRCQISQKSKVSSTKTRQAVIARAPKLLAIHINRSVFDEMTGTLSKNYADVRFPLRLGLDTWCLGGTPRLGDGGEWAEHWNTDPSESMLSIDASAEGRTDSKIYELRAALTHYGRHENGHYICYRRHETGASTGSTTHESNKETWWRFSDEDVSPVSEENVLAQGGVFMLFYEQVDNPSPPSINSSPTIEQPQSKDNTIADREPNCHGSVPLAADEFRPEDDEKAHSNISFCPEATPPEADTQLPTGEPVIEPTTYPTSILEQPTPETNDSVPNVPQLSPSSTTLNPPPSPHPAPSILSDQPSSSSSLTRSNPAPSQPPEDHVKRENRHSFSRSMRTATPRSGRGNKGMGRVSSSSMVTAN